MFRKKIMCDLARHEIPNSFYTRRVGAYKKHYFHSTVDVSNEWTDAREAFGNAMVAINNYLVIRHLMHGYEEERLTSNSQLHDAIHVMIKMNKRNADVQRATTSTVMKTHPHEPVELTTQTAEVQRSCPQCQGHKSIDMSKCWVISGRHRFPNGRCTVCKTNSRLGTRLRCHNNMRRHLRIV